MSTRIFAAAVSFIWNWIAGPWAEPRLASEETDRGFGIDPNG